MLTNKMLAQNVDGLSQRCISVGPMEGGKKRSTRAIDLESGFVFCEALLHCTHRFAVAKVLRNNKRPGPVCDCQIQSHNPLALLEETWTTDAAAQQLPPCIVRTKKGKLASASHASVAASLRRFEADVGFCSSAS